jgi:hypothetical protein
MPISIIGEVVFGSYFSFCWEVLIMATNNIGNVKAAQTPPPPPPQARPNPAQQSAANANASQEAQAQAQAQKQQNRPNAAGEINVTA